MRTDLKIKFFKNGERGRKKMCEGEGERECV